MEFEVIQSKKVYRSKIETILSNRGIEDIEHYLHTSAGDIFPPSTLAFIDDGVKMLAKHIANNDDIYMIIDEDCDGYTSVALFMNYLYNLFPTFVRNHIIYDVHDRKTHGIDVSRVPDNVKLVVILDAGSGQFDAHEALADCGIEVMVVDHHHVDVPSGYNKAIIINNNAKYEDFENPYPNKTLCGVAMTYKLCWRIDEIMGTNYVEKYKDLAMMGLVGDMMSIREYETIQMIREGLADIRNPFFLEMMNRNKSQFTEGITMHALSFYVIPYVNAVARMGSREERLMMFESMLEYKANELIPSTKRGHKGELERVVEQATRMCNNIKQSKQAEAAELGTQLAEFQIQEKNLLNDKFIILQFEEGLVERDTNGLIANKLCNKYQRPVLMLQRDGDQGTWSGSGRGISSMGSFRNFLNDSGLVEHASGHDAAFGTTIKDENIQKLKDYAQEVLKDTNFSATYKVDFVIDQNEIDENEIYEIGDLKYLWGQELPEPLIAIEGIKVSAENFAWLGANKSTLKIHIKDNLSIIKKFVKNEEKPAFDPAMGSYVMDLVGTCSRNTYNDISSPQIELVDCRIKKKMMYDF